MLMILVTIILLAEAAGAAKYVGCFGDTNNTDMPGVTISFKQLKKCINFCMSEDYRAAIYREGCYCGKSFGQGPLPEGRCYAFCPGALAEECVGQYTHSVWFTGEKEKEGSESSESASAAETVAEIDIFLRQSSGNAQDMGGTIYLGDWGVTTGYTGYDDYGR